MSKLLAAIRRLNDAKEKSAEAKDLVLQQERVVIALSGWDKPIIKAPDAVPVEKQKDGEPRQRTFNEKTGYGKAKIVIKEPINTKVDGEIWETIRRGLPAGDPIKKELMRIKYELAAEFAKKLQEDDPAIWITVAKCITRKPGKLSVEIKSLEISDGDALDLLDPADAVEPEAI